MTPQKTSVAVLALALLIHSGTAWAAPQTKDQQKCINKINKDGIKVQATQGKENTECVKCKKNALKSSKEPFANGAAAASDLEVCVDDPGVPNSVAADSKGKIAKRQQNLLDTITLQCNPATFTRHIRSLPRATPSVAPVFRRA